MKNKFKYGDKIYVPTYVELKMMGWKDKLSVDYGIFHDDINPSSFIIHKEMYTIYGGVTVTVVAPFSGYTEGLYHIKEDKCQWSWPLDVLDKQWHWFTGGSISNLKSHIHEEGMTPIDGWFICKTCGTNLREIK